MKTTKEVVMKTVSDWLDMDGDFLMEMIARLDLEDVLEEMQEKGELED